MHALHLKFEISQQTHWMYYAPWEIAPSHIKIAYNPHNKILHLQDAIKPFIFLVYVHSGLLHRGTYSAC